MVDERDEKLSIIVEKQVESGEQKMRQNRSSSNFFIEIPKGIPEILTPIPYVLPLQLFAYYSALERNRDPDKPRNLAKSVTVK